MVKKIRRKTGGIKLGERRRRPKRPPN